MRIFKKLPEPLLVMPFVLDMVDLLGISVTKPRRYRFLCMFLFVTIVNVMPKAFCNYGSLPRTFQGVSELFFEINIYSASVLISVQIGTLLQLVELLQKTTDRVSGDGQPKRYREFCAAVNDSVDSFSRGFAKRMFVVIGITFLVAVLSSCYSALTDPPELVEFTLQLEQCFYGLDVNTNPWHYALYTMIVNPHIYISATLLTFKVSVKFSAIRHCTAMFQLVQMKIKQLDWTEEDELRDELNDIIDLHKIAFRCAGMLESILKYAMLTQFMLCVLIWCTMVFFITSNGLTANAINVGFLLTIVTAETYGLCKSADRLTAESFAVGTVIYNDFKWYNHPADIKKSVLFIIHKSQHTVGITAAKFYFINIERFGSVAQAAYSYYLILKDLF